MPQEQESALIMVNEQMLGALVRELDSDDLAGIVLGGSYARGDATAYSDLDIALLTVDDSGLHKKRFLYRDGLLVSIAHKNLAGIRADMAKPNTAIWVVPGIGDCRVLLDKNGSVGALMAELGAFQWEPLQEAADAYAGRLTMISAEMVHKMIGELLKGDELSVLYVTGKLLSGVTEAVAVQRGVLVKSDNTYYRQVEESVGAGSEWTRLHRIAAGAGPLRNGQNYVAQRGLAALELYRETVALLRGSMAREHLAVAEGALQVLNGAWEMLEGIKRAVESQG